MEYRTAIMQLNPQQLVFVDETGFVCFHVFYVYKFMFYYFTAFEKIIVLISFKDILINYCMLYRIRD